MIESFFEKRAQDAILAASEVMFPANELGAPDHHQAEMVSRTLAWMDELPSPQRKLVVLLFVAVELFAPLLGAGWGRFSRLSETRRGAAIRRWRTSRFYVVRIIGSSLKATLSMIYLSHPDVLVYLGMFKGCDHPSDPLSVNIETDALARVSLS